MKFDSEKIERIEKINFKIPEFDSERLDGFLFTKFPSYSRSYFQKLIKQKFVLINSKVICKSSYKLKKGDILEIIFPKPVPFNLSAKKVDFDTVDVQKDFIVVSKPAGLLTHHSESSQGEVSLVNGLLYKFKELEEFSDKDRPGIVHRLDRGTSGLMLVARNQEAQIKLSNMFRDRLIKKEYLAVVKGHPPKDGKIDFPVGRHPKHRNLMSHLSFRGKPALTYFSVLEYFKESSLISVKIVTGRTHQIRVHFSAIGHGLVGDRIYGINSKLIERPALHSHKLCFTYKNRDFEYINEPPKDFLELLKALKSS